MDGSLLVVLELLEVGLFGGEAERVGEGSLVLERELEEVDVVVGSGVFDELLVRVSETVLVCVVDCVDVLVVVIVLEDDGETLLDSVLVSERV